MIIFGGIHTYIACLIAKKKSQRNHLLLCKIQEVESNKSWICRLHVFKRKASSKMNSRVFSIIYQQGFSFQPSTFFSSLSLENWQQNNAAIAISIAWSNIKTIIRKVNKKIEREWMKIFRLSGKSSMEHRNTESHITHRAAVKRGSAIDIFLKL